MNKKCINNTTINSKSNNSNHNKLNNYNILQNKEKDNYTKSKNQ